MATQYTAGLSSGQVLTAATMNSIGAAWETWTPTLTQTVNVTKTLVNCRYAQIQKTVFALAQMAVTGAGTAGTGILVGLPIAARVAGPITAFGYIYDASANTVYNVSGLTNATTNMGFFYQSGFFVGQAPNFALANGDAINILAIYEVA